MEVDGSRRHVFDCFALENAALCSSAKPRAGVDDRVGRGGAPPDVFYRNCTPHLGATIGLLHPTVVIVQGRRTGTGWSPTRALKEVAYCIPVNGDDQLVNATLPATVGHTAHRFVATLFPHPGVQDERSWQAGWASRYFQSDVAPRLHTARQFAAESSNDQDVGA